MKDRKTGNRLMSALEETRGELLDEVLEQRMKNREKLKKKETRRPRLTALLIAAAVLLLAGAAATVVLFTRRTPPAEPGTDAREHSAPATDPTPTPTPTVPTPTPTVTTPTPTVPTPTDPTPTVPTTPTEGPTDVYIFGGLYLSADPAGTGYNIVGTVDPDATQMELPGTVNGLPVVGVYDGDPSAFDNIDTLFIRKETDKINDFLLSRICRMRNLKRIIAEEGNPTYVTRGNCLIDRTTGTVLMGFDDSVIPYDGSVTTVGSYAFYGCTFERLVLPDAITFLRPDAFGCCTALKSVVLGNGLTDARCAFRGCTALETAELPESLECAQEMFENCTALKEVLLKATPFLMMKMFKGCTSLEKIELPEEKAGRTGGLSAAHAFEGCTSLREVTLPSTWIRIDDGVFINCTALEKVSIPSGITEIAEEAFKGCAALQIIEGGEGLVDIDETAFSGTDALSLLLFEDEDCLYIRNSLYRFKDPARTGSYAVKAEVAAISGNAFKDCSLGEIILPEGVKTVSFGAFMNCGDLVSIVLPEGLTAIGYDAFKNCSALAKIDLPESLCVLEEGAFANCVSLLSVSLPKNVEYVPDSLFAGCTALSELHLPGVKECQPCFRNCPQLAVIEVSDCFEGGFFGLNTTAFYNDPDNWEDGALYLGKVLVGVGSANDPAERIEVLKIKDGTRFAEMNTSNWEMRKANTLYVPASYCSEIFFYGFSELYLDNPECWGFSFGGGFEPIEDYDPETVVARAIEKYGEGVKLVRTDLTNNQDLPGDSDNN